MDTAVDTGFDRKSNINDYDLAETQNVKWDKTGNGFDHKSNIDDYDLTESQKAKWEKLVSIHVKLRRAADFVEGANSNTDVKVALMKLNESLHRTEYLLQPEIYNLVFLGSSGHGKSTILNILMGRDLLPTGVGGAITGAVIFIEATDEKSDEKAVIQYCEPEELKMQVAELVRLTGIMSTEELLKIFDEPNPDEKDLKAQLDDLEELHRNTQTASDKRSYIAIIWDILNSYKNYWRELRKETRDNVQDKDRKLTKVFRIPDDREILRDTINESQNYFDATSLKDLSNGKRVIRLIARVNYYVHPSKSKHMGKLLKNNIRVVDVPGFGEKNPVHEILTKNLVREMEPMFALVASSERIAQDSTRDVFKWVHDNYIAIADGDRDLIRSVSEGIFIIVNNKSNINLETKSSSSTFGDTNCNESGKNNINYIDTINMSVDELIGKYISTEYLNNFKGRGQNAKPYILVTPLPVAFLQNQNDQIDENQLAGFYQMYYNSLNISPYISADDAKKFVMERSGIPTLRDQFFSFLVNRRVDTQIERACKYFKIGVEGLGGAINNVVGEIDLTDPNMRAREILETKDDEFKDLLSEIRKELFVEFGKDNDSVKPFVSVFKGSQANAKKDLEQLVNSFEIEKHIKVIISPITGQEVIQTTRGELGNAIDIDIQQRFRTYAKQFANELLVYFELKLDRKGVKIRLNEITYGKRYDYTMPAQSGLGAKQKVNEIVKIYNYNVNLFVRDYTEAFSILMVYELLRDKKRLAFSRLTPLVQKPDSKTDTKTTETKDSSLVREEMDEISEQVREIIKNVTEILDDSPTNPLFLGLRKHFFYLYIGLKDNLEKLHRKVVGYHSTTSDPNLIKMILERDNAYEDERVALAGALNELGVLYDELSDLC